MSYYDQDFKPLEIVDGRAVVADEAEWGKLLEWDLLRSKFPKGDRTIVKLTTDIFEDVADALVVNEKGGHFFDDKLNPVRCSDLLARFLLTIELTQQVDYLIVTRHPELVREKWGWAWRRGDLNTYGAEILEDKRIVRPNVILAVPVETQADIERLIPELLKCHDLCKGLEVICNPKERLHVEPYLTRSYEPTEDYTGLQGIDRIVVEGNEHPIHPDWLRHLRDQCLDANVPFNFAGWGDWVAMGQDVKKLPVGDYQMKEVKDDYYLKVGKVNAGRLLDGQEHNGRVS